MAGTPKSLRQPPARTFENYTLTRATAPNINITQIPDSLFTGCPEATNEVTSGGAPGTGYVHLGISSPIDIGFDFTFNGVTYKKFVASTSGWMVLVDPLTTFSSSHILASGSSDPNILAKNENIKGTFTGSHTLLAPWFDNIRNIASSPEQVYGSCVKTDRINQGLEPRPSIIDPVSYGTKYCFDQRNSRGKRLIVRWNSLADIGVSDAVIKFESIIYENGTIEYRYAPRSTINLPVTNVSSSATVGIFTFGDSSKFRDFSLDMGYRDGTRAQYRLGGAVYTGSYVDVDQYSGVTASYTVNLEPRKHWPALTDAGSIFTFTPPQTLRKVLPKLESPNRSSRLTLPTVARTGDARRGNDPIYFDDRKSLLYVKPLDTYSLQVTYDTSSASGSTAATTLYDYYFALYPGGYNYLGSYVGYNAYDSSTWYDSSGNYIGDFWTWLSSTYGETVYNQVYSQYYNGADVSGGSISNTTTIVTVTVPVTRSVVVNAPSMMQRFYSDSEPNIIGRQNVFVGDIEFTSRIPLTVGEQWIINDLPQQIAPFSEHKLFDNDPTSPVTPFFMTGSNITEIGDGLVQSLRSKTQIKLSLPVKSAVSLFPTASSIHYYNARSKSWGIPRNSTYTVNSQTSIVNDSGNALGDIFQDYTGSFGNYQIFEDYKGFGPIGNFVCSGSHKPVNNRSGVNVDQSDSSIGSTYTTEAAIVALSKQYDKSINVNNNYRATDDELFTLPINHPFIIERAVIEVPLAMGQGWFDDITTSISPFFSGTTNDMRSFDFGGPGITVALFNQTTVGNQSRRDLILTGTVTHRYDNIATIRPLVLEKSGSAFTTAQNVAQGFRTFGAVPSVVITPTSTSAGLTYTGSVPIKCEAQVSNGIIVHLEMSSSNGSTGANDIINTKEIVLEDRTYTNFGQTLKIAWINNFGRGGTGFDPSPRSVFGKEFTTTSEISSQGKIKNPFYQKGTNDVNISYGDGTVFTMALPLNSTKPSPYLVLPNDKLVLSISKTRPVFLTGSYVQMETSGSHAHDVLLCTGAINITLFGSLLKEGKEFHDTLNQPLASDAVHEIVIGNEPVLDQFETEYRNTFSSGSNDDYIQGTLVQPIKNVDVNDNFDYFSDFGFGITQNSQTSVVSFVTGSRGRIYSKNNARDIPISSVGTSVYDYTTSEAYRLQPYYEKAGTVRVKQVTDLSERFWDTLMPSFSECLTADGASIFIQSSITGLPTSNNYGFVWFDYEVPDYLTGSSAPFDGIWTKSFPFEPRYSHIARQQDMDATFIANYVVTFAGSPSAGAVSHTVNQISPTQVDGLFFGPAGSFFPSVPPIEYPNVNPSRASLYAGSTYRYKYHTWLWVSDVDVTTNLTTSAGNTDMLKALYGFGDLNNMKSSSVGGTTIGTNHFSDFRSYHLRDDSANSKFGHIFGVSPVIRGWKYGVYSGTPLQNKAYYRNKSYGQFRDMLEQRPYTKFFISPENIQDGQQGGVTPSAVSVKFIDPSSGKSTNPSITASSNLSFEATSSLPYFDGEARNRGPYVPTGEVASVNIDENGQIVFEGNIG